MVTIAELKNGQKNGGSINAQVTGKRVKQNQKVGTILELDVLDQSAVEGQLTIFNPAREPEIGDTVYSSKNYVKEFRGNRQIIAGMGSEISFSKSNGLMVGSKQTRVQDQPSNTNEHNLEIFKGGYIAGIEDAINSMHQSLIQKLTEFQVSMLDQLKTILDVMLNPPETCEEDLDFEDGEPPGD